VRETDACRYAAARREVMLAEASPSRMGEIELQARLYNGEFGTRWQTTDGRAVEVVHFGEWNREAGPDFTGAVVDFGDGGTVGDIELDPDVRDWERHGHATNPDFEGTVLQFFVSSGAGECFARTADNRHVAQVRLSPVPEAAPSVPAAVPVAPDDAREMIRRAGNFRLRAKHAARAAAESLHGRKEAFFQALATGLGYRNNTIPFLLVAQRASLSRAGSRAGESLLFGLAGFLEPRTFDDADGPTREYLKPLWERWWAVRDQYARLVLPPRSWRFSGLRPQNHPHRRLAALASLARNFRLPTRMLDDGDWKGFRGFLERLEHPYWSMHWNLSAATLGRSMALVGRDRATDLVINAFLPALDPDRALEILKALPGPWPSGKVRRAAEWLAGEHGAGLLRSAADQQGLLQLHRDFSRLTAAEALGRISGKGNM
jgi:hypothetical protein